MRRCRLCRLNDRGFARGRVGSRAIARTIEAALVPFTLAEPSFGAAIGRAILAARVAAHSGAKRAAGAALETVWSAFGASFAPILQAASFFAHFLAATGLAKLAHFVAQVSDFVAQIFEQVHDFARAALRSAWAEAHREFMPVPAAAEPASAPTAHAADAWRTLPFIATPVATAHVAPWLSVVATVVVGVFVMASLAVVGVTFMVSACVWPAAALVAALVIFARCKLAKGIGLGRGGERAVE